MMRLRARTLAQISLWIAGFLLVGATAALAQKSPEETAVWKLEHSYWEYVKAGDLTGYRALWHPDFVGWPSASTFPLRKDHITDWITNLTDKGQHLKSYKLELAESQKIRDVVVVHYWVTVDWVDKDGEGEPGTLRITHTWMRVGQSWQIIGGMSSREAHARP